MWIPKIPFLRIKESPVTYRQPQPTVFPKLDGVQMAALYKGARIGGDFYDVVATSTRLIFILLDIAGKREEAFHIAADVQDKFRELAPSLFNSHSVNEAEASSDLLLQLNRAIIDSAGGTTHFSAAFLGCYSLPLGTLCYINAGHTPALLKDSTGVHLLESSGLPLGLFSHAMHDAQISVLEPGATLLLVSRGVVESRRKRREFGIDNVRKLLAAHPVETAHDVCSAALTAVEEFANGSTYDNDLTTLTLLRPAAAVARGVATGAH